MRNRPGLLVGLALLMGILASYLTVDYLQREEAAYRDAYLRSQQQDTVAVVVAKYALDAGTTIDTSNMAIRQVPTDYVYPDTVAPGDFERVAGQSLTRPLAQGQPLPASYLSEGGLAGFSDTLAEGRRALTLHVNDINSISGFLRPEDYVDLFVTVRSGTGSRTQPLLEAVRVLATGALTRAEHERLQQGAGMHFTTVTLDVAPEEAEQVILSQLEGQLTILLRNPRDQTRNTPPPITELAVASPPVPEGPAPAQPSRQQVRYVEYLSGGRDGVVQVLHVPVTPVVRP